VKRLLPSSKKPRKGLYLALTTATPVVERTHSKIAFRNTCSWMPSEAASHGVDHVTKLDDTAVARALDDAAAIGR
jgi:hypothetical protein